MTTVVTRSVKGGKLTWAEMDANINNLNTDKLEASDLPIDVGFRNKIINGNFDHWQRASISAAGYLADRFATGATGSTVASSRQAFAAGQTEVPGEPSYFIRHAVTSVAGAGNFTNFKNRIEDVRTLAGRSAVLSFYAKADASKNIAVEISQEFGSGGSPVVHLTPVTCALTTTWQKFVVPVSIPSLSGKTSGTIHYLEVQWWFDAGSNHNTRTNSLGQQSGTFDIALVQIEEGSIVTPFEQRPYGVELALCERYFWRPNIGCPVQEYAEGAGFATFTQIFFPVTMRGIPTISASWGSLVNCTGTAINALDKHAATSGIVAVASGGFTGTITWDYFDAEI